MTRRLEDLTPEDRRRILAELRRLGAETRARIYTVAELSLLCALARPSDTSPRGASVFLPGGGS